MLLLSKRCATLEHIIHSYKFVKGGDLHIGNWEFELWSKSHQRLAIT